MKKSMGILFIFFTGVLSFLIMYVNFWGIRQNNYKINVRIDNSSNLSLGTPVLMNGVKVGKVQDIYLKSDKVIIVLCINRNVKIPLGSSVQINYKGLIGDVLVNIFRSTSENFYEDNAFLEGKGAVSTSMLLEKVTQVAEQLEQITKDIADSKLKVLIKNIESFSMNVNKTYTDFERIFEEFKTDNYEKFKNTISNLESSSKNFKNFLDKTENLDVEQDIKKIVSNLSNVTTKAYNVINTKVNIFPELKIIPKNNGLDYDGAIGLEVFHLFIGKKGFKEKDKHKGYTCKIMKNIGPVTFSTGILNDFLGLGLTYNPIEFFSMGADFYNIEDVQIDILGKLFIKNVMLSSDYKTIKKEFSLGIGYRF